MKIIRIISIIIPLLAACGESRERETNTQHVETQDSETQDEKVEESDENADQRQVDNHVSPDDIYPDVGDGQHKSPDGVSDSDENVVADNENDMPTADTTSPDSLDEGVEHGHENPIDETSDVPAEGNENTIDVHEDIRGTDLQTLESGRILTQDDTDSYSFDVGPATCCQVQVTPFDMDPVLVTMHGDRIDGQYTGDDEIWGTCELEGSFDFTIEGYQGSTGDYQLEVICESNATSELSLSFGESYLGSGRILASDEADHYVVSDLAPGTCCVANVTPFDMDTVLVGMNGDRVDGQYTSQTEEWGTCQIDGEFSFSVEGYQGSTGLYQLHVICEAD